MGYHCARLFLARNRFEKEKFFVSVAEFRGGIFNTVRQTTITYHSQGSALLPSA